MGNYQESVMKLKSMRPGETDYIDQLSSGNPEGFKAYVNTVLAEKATNPGFMSALMRDGHVADFADTFSILGGDLSKYESLAGYAQDDSMWDKFAKHPITSAVSDVAKRGFSTPWGVMKSAIAGGVKGGGVPSPSSAWGGVKTNMANLWDMDKPFSQAYDEAGLGNIMQHATGVPLSSGKETGMKALDIAGDIAFDPLAAIMGSSIPSKIGKMLPTGAVDDASMALLKKGQVHGIKPYNPNIPQNVEMRGRSLLNPTKRKYTVHSEGGVPYQKTGSPKDILEMLGQSAQKAPSPVSGSTLPPITGINAAPKVESLIGKTFPYKGQSVRVIEQTGDDMFNVVDAGGKRYAVGGNALRTPYTPPAPKVSPAGRPTNYYDASGKLVTPSPKGGVDIGRGTLRTTSAQSGSAMKDVQAVKTLTGANRSTVERIGDRMGQLFHSPHRVLEDSKVGSWIINQIEKAKRGEMSFLHKHSVAVVKATGSLNKNQRLQVMGVLEGKVPTSAVDAKVTKAAEIYRTSFDNLWEEGVRRGIFDPATREVNYAPHIFDPDSMAEFAQTQARILSEKMQGFTGDQLKLAQNQLKTIQGTIKDITGGNLYSLHQKDFANLGKLGFAEPRIAKQGLQELSYLQDIEQVYGAYVRGLGRQIYRKPALKASSEAFGGVNIEGKLEFLPLNKQKYAKEYLEDWAGAHKLSDLEKASGMIRGFEFVRLLGLNPRSAVVNLTQQINNLAGLGLMRTASALHKIATNAKAPAVLERHFGAKGWQKVFENSGLADEVRFQFVGSAVPRWLQKVNDTTGYMFNRVEILNKGTAWIGSVDKALKQGKSLEKALEIGYKNVRDWQFFYGKTGLPAAMRKPLQATILQFWSFPIKQFELLSSMSIRALRRDPEAMKFIGRFLGLAISGDLIAQNILGININNALGLGIDSNEMVSAIESLSEGELKEMYEHIKEAMAALNPTSGVPGLIPSGPGPALGHFKASEDARKKGWSRTIYEHLMPLQMQRFDQALSATPSGDEYMMRNPITGQAKYKLSGADIFKRTFIAKPQREFEEQRKARKYYDIKDEETRLINNLRKAVNKGDSSAVNKYIQMGIQKGFDAKKLIAMMKYQAKNRNVPQSLKMERKYPNYGR